MGPRDQILTMAADHFGTASDRLNPNDLFGKNKLEGDDASEFWEEFASTFGVDLTNLRTYLHYDANEPPGWRTVWGIGANGHRIPDIPIGLADLQTAVETGKWQMTYPAHRLQERRVLTPSIASLLLVFALIYLVWSTFLR